ncbi:unnamed protein product [Pleuronectes platessa]|uniref:Uncharacterized protein n=1 Tax=Pleuronectes platessa TaxID=8262 RepID=A0A9N7TY82_PLEPL|nr:unnamed protein product [Pleuronectes platessa]
MIIDIPKDNPNMTCQAVPLQSQSMVSNHPDQTRLQSSVKASVCFSESVAEGRTGGADGPFLIYSSTSLLFRKQFTARTVVGATEVELREAYLMRTHHEPPPRSWSTARAQCQRDTGSATSTTISPHNSESATLDPTPRPPVRDPQTAIHGAATEALDLRVIKQRDSGEGG